MKVIQTKDRKYRFDYKTESMIFFGHTHVALLSKETGSAKQITIEELKNTLTTKHFETVMRELMLINEWENANFHIVGLESVSWIG